MPTNAPEPPGGQLESVWVLIGIGPVHFDHDRGPGFKPVSRSAEVVARCLQNREDARTALPPAALHLDALNQAALHGRREGS
jgi:hypothetical protein